MAFDTLMHNLVLGDSTRCPQFVWSPSLDPGPMTISDFLKKLEDSPSLSGELRNVDLVAGGPPCQGFSLAGRRNVDDPRNELFYEYLEVVSMIRPRAIVLENVRGVAVSHGNATPYSQRIADGLHELGYACYKTVLSASDFGVPQRRPRFFLIAVDACYFSVPSEEWLGLLLEESIQEGNCQLHEKHGLPIGKQVTARDALADLEIGGRALVDANDAPRRQQLDYQGVSAAETSPYLAIMRRNAPLSMNSMRLANHSEAVKAKFEKLIDHAIENGRAGIVLHETERAEILQTKKHSVTILDPESPAPTLTTLPDDLLHYSEPRILTVRECARLQSFPDWFSFKGKYTTGGKKRTKECPRYTQVGNAVAPLVGEAIGIGIRMLLDKLQQRVPTDDVLSAAAFDISLASGQFSEGAVYG